MFVEHVDATDELEQGDVCLSIPLPTLNTKEQLLLKNNDTKDSPPTSELCQPGKLAGFFLPVNLAPVMVLSQSCDLVDLDASSHARILVAPLCPDNDERFNEFFKKEMEKTYDGTKRKAIASFTGKNLEGVKAAHEDATRKLNNARNVNLRRLWLGELVGAFPIAAFGEHLERSICFFDNVVSLNSQWGEILRIQRICRLDHVWKSVLQEQLIMWLGRYAYPGLPDDRMLVGLSKEEAGISEKDEAAAQPKETQKANEGKSAG